MIFFPSPVLLLPYPPLLETLSSGLALVPVDDLGLAFLI